MFNKNETELTDRVQLGGFNKDLTSLIIPEDFTCGGDLSGSNNKLTSLTIPNKDLTSLIIPEDFTCGGDLSGSNNKLTSLTIPEWFTVY